MCASRSSQQIARRHSLNLHASLLNSICIMLVSAETLFTPQDLCAMRNREIVSVGDSDVKPVTQPLFRERVKHHA